MISNEKEIMEVMKEIHSYFQNLKNIRYDEITFKKMIAKAKTVGIEILHNLGYDEDSNIHYLNDVEIAFNDEVDEIYSNLWCQVVGIWPEEKINEITKLIVDFCETNNLKLYKASLRFNKESIMSADLLIESELCKQNVSKTIDDILNNN